uniref:Uncharacterized protein n=1 Tax=Knipowitschia caucasica TaxID=637954 RepID=A0AAV2MK58_KNICA
MKIDDYRDGVVFIKMDRKREGWEEDGGGELCWLGGLGWFFGWGVEWDEGVEFVVRGVLVVVWWGFFGVVFLVGFVGRGVVVVWLFGFFGLGRSCVGMGLGGGGGVGGFFFLGGGGDILGFFCFFVGVLGMWCFECWGCWLWLGLFGRGERMRFFGFLVEERVYVKRCGCEDDGWWGGEWGVGFLVDVEGCGDFVCGGMGFLKDVLEKCGWGVVGWGGGGIGGLFFWVVFVGFFLGCVVGGVGWCLGVVGGWGGGLWGGFLVLVGFGCVLVCWGLVVLVWGVLFLWCFGFLGGVCGLGVLGVLGVCVGFL